jgi:hypothetical protein
MANIKALLDAMPTTTRVEVFDHEKAFGVIVAYSEAGYGFGEFTLAVDKATGEASVDLETTKPDRCGRILMRAVGSPVVDAAALEASEYPSEDSSDVR